MLEDKFVPGFIMVIFNQGTTEEEADALFQTFGFSEVREMPFSSARTIYVVPVLEGEEDAWIIRFRECEKVGTATRIGNPIFEKDQKN